MEFESTEKFQMIYEPLKAAIAYFRKQLFSNNNEHKGTVPL